jgi:hypothetical protein
MGLPERVGDHMKITHFDAAYSDVLGGKVGLSGKGVVSTVDPTATDDSAHGYTVGVHWVNRTTGEEFVLVDGAVGAAVWTSTTAGASLTVKDEGTPLATVADTLDFVGAGVVASGAGGTKTITISGASVADILRIFALGG